METTKVTSNWLHANKSDLSTIVNITPDVEDIFIRPEVEEIVNEDRAVLLTRPENEKKSSCRLHFEVQPMYKISALSLVCTSTKLEVYMGPLLEYADTYFGEEVEEGFSYVYHIEVQRSGITQLELKLIDGAESVCIFGVIMQTAPNPNGITTQQNINFENVQEILGKSPNHMEKCKLFMQMMNKMDVLPKNVKAAANAVAAKEHSEMQQNLIETALKTHIDMRLVELETKLNARLDQIEGKLTEFFNMLGKDKME